MPNHIIDTHIHVWDFSQAAYPWLANDTSILNRNYNIQELEQERLLTNVKSGILVQAAGNEEDTAWMLKVAEHTSWIKAVVGWLPLMQPETTFSLLTQQYLNQPYFKGVRHQIHDEADSKWLLQPQVLESLNILAEHQLPFDVVGMLPAHIEVVLEIANLIPHLKMVFNHLNQPPINGGQMFGRWDQLMMEAAKHPNFYAKISGLGTASGNFIGRTNESIKPYIAFALQHFGTDRCFCGGDWPVSNLGGSYSQIWQCYESIITELLQEVDAQKVFYTNAKAFYQL